MLNVLAVFLFAVLVATDAGDFSRKKTKRTINSQCQGSNVVTTDVELNDLSGVWYKVLHKYHASTGKTSSTFKLEPQGNELKMTGYYTKDGKCEGPISGKWTKPRDGKIHMEITKTNGGKFQVDVDIVYYYQHPHINEEQVIAFYTCKSAEQDGSCKSENQFGAILSKNRRPSTNSLFSAAKALQNACLDPRTLTRLDTLTSCGDELLEESAEDDEEESSEDDTSDDPCLVDNISGIEYTVDDMRPQKYYMIAAYDGTLTKMGITMFTVEYKGEIEGNKIKVYTRFIKHGVCFKGVMEEWVDPNNPTVWRTKSQIRTPAGPREIEIPFKVIYNRNGVSIAYWCTETDPLQPGRCKVPQVSILSTSPHVGLGQLILALYKLKSICVSTKNMIFMNTHAHCRNPFDISTHAHDPSSVPEADKCKVASISASEHFSLDQLEGVWYLAAGIGIESILPTAKSAVVKRTKVGDVLNSHAYINFQDGSCVSLNGSTQVVSVEDAIVSSEVKGIVSDKEITVKLRQKVLHAGSQSVLYYWCREENSDGTCKAPLLRLDSKTRELRHRDVLNVKSHIEELCIDLDSITWFFLNSECGKQFDSPFKERHGYLALTHTDTMDIITKFSSPMCKVSDIKGMNVCFKKMAASGPWYSVAMYDAKWADWDFYGSITKMKYTGNGTVSIREYAVFNAGDGKTCHEVLGSAYVANDTDKNDVTYMGKWSMLGQEFSINFKWVWTNYRIGIGYWCRIPARDGTCPTNQVSVYITSNSDQTMDHAEWLLVEQVLKSLCVDPRLLRHLTPHEYCLIEHAESGNSMYPPKNNCNWEQFKGVPFTTEQAQGTYHGVAFASKTTFCQNVKSRVYKMEKIDDDNLKLTIWSTKTTCVEQVLRLRRGPDEESNQWITSVQINGEDTPVSIWLGNRVGPYRVMFGCTGSDCNEETGFVVIASEYRAQDKIAIQETYQYLQDNCINPDWLTFLDTHSACGARIDTRSCLVADFQGLPNYNEDGFQGVWYLTVHANQRYDSMKCKAEKSDDGITVTCYTKMEERCVGPSEGKFTRDEDKPGQITYSFASHGKVYTADYYLLYQDNDHLLMVGCQYLNGDGSCVASRTSVMIWSKNASITPDSMPEGVLQKLESVCIHSSRLEYLEENDCGKELN